MTEFTGDAEGWYHSKMSWTGDWRYNIWFSIGSSVAFALVCLVLGWLRLIRIDF